MYKRQELEGGSDTKMYITELKEHVIIQEHKVRSDGTTIVGDGDELVEGAEYEGAVEHLIIDGQVIYNLCISLIYFQTIIYETTYWQLLCLSVHKSFI